jgi:hypothetical protein
LCQKAISNAPISGSNALRRRAKKQFGIRKAKCGAVTFIQRFGGAINLNVHFHSLVMDGIYHEDSNKRIRFRRLPAPADPEVAQVTAVVVKKMLGLLERRGMGPKAVPEEADPLLLEQPLLAELYSASVQGRIASGPGAGERLKGVKFEFELESEGKKPGPRCANLSGFSLHANVCIPAKARHQFEDLQPDYTQAGPQRVAHHQNCTRGASMAWRRCCSVAELR